MTFFYVYSTHPVGLQGGWSPSLLASHKAKGDTSQLSQLWLKASGHHEACASMGAQMDPSGKSKGPPPAVKKVLSLFGSGREEDRMVGYLSFLKIGPKLLKFLPGTALSAPAAAHTTARLPVTLAMP